MKMSLSVHSDCHLPVILLFRPTGLPISFTLLVFLVIPPFFYRKPILPFSESPYRLPITSLLWHVLYAAYLFMCVAPIIPQSFGGQALLFYAFQ